jgi:hypothetical protein
MPALVYALLSIPPIAMTTGKGLVPEGNTRVAEIFAVFPPAAMLISNFVPERVAVTVSCEWSG